MAFSTNNLLGANLALTYAPISASTPDIPGLPYALGQTTLGTDGTQWVFVVATGGAITQYDLVGIDENFVAQPLTIVNAMAGYRVGAAQVAFTSGYYGWVVINGSNISVRAAGACAKDAVLYITATPGVVDDAQTDTSVNAQISGLVAIVDNSDTSVTVAVEMMMVWPKSAAI